MIYLEKNASARDLLTPESLPNRYHMDQPFELLQITVKPKEKGESLTILQMVPNSAIYLHFSLREFDEYAGESTDLLHAHDYYELLFVREGQIYQNIDNDRHFYGAGCCCIVSPDTMHSEEYAPDTDARLIFVKLSKDYVKSLQRLPLYFPEEENLSRERLLAFLAGKSPFMDFIPREGVDGASLLFPEVDGAARVILEPGRSASLLVTAKIHQLLLLLFDQSLFGNTPISPGTKTEQLLFARIREFMEKNEGRISRADLEEKFHYSGDYLYKVIKSRTGLSIHAFSLHMSMQRAAQLLATTDLKVEKVAELAGFGNGTQFYKAFADAYHMTPAKYRKAARSRMRGEAMALDANE
ncbi:MAG: helix-turn-helix domain-containing protein [Blautia sp.]|nr:helix-turn-helix domain-containing protein [Blautia sp.]